MGRRIFEKAYGRIQTMMAGEGGLDKLFVWASGVGREVSELREQGRNPSRMLAQYAISTSSSAPRSATASVDASASSPARRPEPGRRALVRRHGDADRRGLRPHRDERGILRQPHQGLPLRLGWALPGTEVRIAEDGEVLLRGPGVMEGYHNNPDATAEALDAEGWLHTGDIGEQDDRGFLRITDRKKDLFKTSGGKYVAPSIIESTFKGLCLYASQLVVYGADRNFVSALITLDPTPSRAGRHSTAWRARPTGDRHLRRLPGDGAGLRRPAQRRPEPLGESRSSRSSRATSPSRTAS